MSFVKTKDGVEIFYKDWGRGQPLVFSHGWPLSADDWDNQMLFFLSCGYRVIAHDRRGHGRSSQVADGHDLDHYADDLAAVTAHLDLKNAIHVGHSTGGGEVVRYLARHSDRRVVKAAIISAVPPLMVKTAANPGGLPKSVFDDLQTQLAANRSEFYRALPEGPFYGFNRPGAKKSEAVIANGWRQEQCSPDRSQGYQSAFELFGERAIKGGARGVASVGARCMFRNWLRWILACEITYRARHPYHRF
jgi:non-heme chloroperoxidase